MFLFNCVLKNALNKSDYCYYISLYHLIIYFKYFWYRSGYSGTTCDVNIDECQSQPCQNGGQCQDLIAQYSCQCASGFTGSTCQTNIDECASSPCLNQGKCTDLVDGYSCNCSGTGFNGSTCNININDCVGSACKNGATCIDQINSYTCNCSFGYTGQYCDSIIDYCKVYDSSGNLISDNICSPNGGCNSIIGRYVCNCSAGYTGQLCKERKEILE